MRTSCPFFRTKKVKKWQHIVLILFLFLGHTSLLNNNSIINIYRILAQKQYLPSQLPIYQKEIAKHFKGNHVPTKTKYLHELINFFAQGDDYPLIKEHKSNLNRAISTFSHISGFSSITTNLFKNIDRENVKGYIYELLHALTIHDSYHEEDPIIAFNSIKRIYHKDGTFLEREFDIETEHYVIECKCRMLTQLPEEHRPIESKLLEQKTIINRYNLKSSHEIRFQLSSYYPLSAEWKQWLHEHDIELHEGW